MVDEGSSLEEFPTRAVDALLASKLRPPPPRLGSISRSRLVDALERGIERRLTLVAAPAGYGKTMMVAQWVAAAPAARIQVWVSPMASDDEPVRFWTLIAAGLQRAGVDLARDVAGFVAAGGDDIETTIIPWLTEAMTGPADLSLIVDDFDRIRSAACLTQIDLLIRRLPANAHLVLITRADPGLRLSRLRVERELSEIRAADLAFTVEEATALVTNEGLHLPTVAVETMVGKCEGWPAGIYLALLAAAGSPDPAEFLDRFAGSHRFIGDYLVEEVLNQQSLEIRTFILDVSILDRSPPRWLTTSPTNSAPRPSSAPCRQRICSSSHLIRPAAGSAFTTCSGSSPSASCRSKPQSGSLPCAAAPQNGSRPMVTSTTPSLRPLPPTGPPRRLGWPNRTGCRTTTRASAPPCRAGFASSAPSVPTPQRSW